ncbi:MAG TPA: phosphatidate cytidylyltransferase [Chloroflexota bacterium]|nr:phosphatidate cytidylyltransferase [Chloroflexota bacterium]
MLSNPLASPYLVPVLWVVLGLLGTSLALLLIGVRGNMRRLACSSLFRRWTVWAVIAPIYALAVMSGPVPLLILLLALTVQGLREYSALVALPGPYRRFLVLTGLLAAPAALVSPDLVAVLLPVLFIVATLQPLLFHHGQEGVRHLAFAALGWAYVAWFLAHLMLLDRDIVGGAGILLAIGLGTALSDVGAFTVGKTFGRHKMAPRLSPNKTWEGGVGNLLGASVGVVLFAPVLPVLLRPALLVLLPPVIALGAVWGDLLESSIKREFGVKDAGTWLPGFGGLLDRIDSLIVVGPLVFYVLHLGVPLMYH